MSASAAALAPSGMCQRNCRPDGPNPIGPFPDAPTAIAVTTNVVPTMPTTASTNITTSHFVLRRAADWRSKKSVDHGERPYSAGGHARISLSCRMPVFVSGRLSTGH